MAAPNIPILPLDAQLLYLAEGAANIVYRISVPPGTPQESIIEEYEDGTPPPSEIEPLTLWRDEFKNKLLRVRKDLPTTLPCVVAQDAWQRLILPLFTPDQIVNQSLIELRQSGIINKLNNELRKQEHAPQQQEPEADSRSRSTKRQGTFLADDPHGLLVTDMTAAGLDVDQDTRPQVIEFKPKWLLQSPNAPRGSKRCRQCALVAQRNAKDARFKDRSSRVFCPLEFVSENPTTLLRISQQVLPAGSSQKQIKYFAKWLETNDLLGHLKKLQLQLDQKGVLGTDTANDNLLVAMTLRDCTVFIKYDSSRPRGVIDARIGDLDVKSPQKLDYWKSIEKDLITEGWYLGTEAEGIRQPLTCSLSYRF